MQNRKILMWIHVLFVFCKRKISVENTTFYPFKSVQNMSVEKQIFTLLKVYRMNLDIFVQFGGPQSGTVIIQSMTELDISYN